MGTVKAMAIELERNQNEAADLHGATAFRLGMLEACRLITEVGNHHVGRGDGDPLLAVHDCWRSVFEAVKYLREVSDS